ncbi:hypothetical protein QN277_006082 [Acacia crassicarpa]|uniref:Uncharacterized protein n=1 Tax=Acacia crassicarpa TaxID=499986 RepID=A0AAE1IZN7_9FABA|nr:hypothetical protein QN277_006082 [Acacia crassicarpa]
MGTFNGSKPASYVLAADNISPDSLSFSGLVSIQDQQSKSPSVTLNQTKQHDQTTNHSPEFEFIVTKPAPKSAAVNSVKTIKPKPANLLISIEQRKAQAIPFQPNHTDHHHHNSSLSSLLSAHHGNGQRVVSGNARKFDGVEKGRRPRSQSFGRKFFKSLVSPCRNCHASKPKAKVH